MATGDTNRKQGQRMNQYLYIGQPFELYADSQGYNHA